MSLYDSRSVLYKKIILNVLIKLYNLNEQIVDFYVMLKLKNLRHKISF